MKYYKDYCVGTLEDANEIANELNIKENVSVRIYKIVMHNDIEHPDYVVTVNNEPAYADDRDVYFIKELKAK